MGRNYVSAVARELAIPMISRAPVPAIRLPSVWVVAIAIVATLLLSVGSMAAEETGAAPYRLGTGDRIHVSVFDQAAVSADAKITLDGSITLPLLGRVPAQGLTPEELSRSIAERLRERKYLDPVVTVSIVAYQPIYVGGFVRSPGRYPYEAGMTAAAAIFSAGGFSWAGGVTDNGPALQSLVIQAKKDLEALSVDRLRLTARIARLRAEIAKSDNVTFPDTLTESANPLAQQFVEAERRLFTLRRNSVSEADAAMERQEAQVNREIEALRNQDKELNKSVALYGTELKDAEQLRAKGFERKVRVLDLQRRMSELNADRYEIAARIVRASQEIGTLEMERIDRRQVRIEKLDNELVLAIKQVSVIDAGLKAAQTQIEVNSGAAGILSATDGPEIKYVLTVDRRKGTGRVTRPITSDSPLRPGDILTVSKTPE